MQTYHNALTAYLSQDGVTQKSLAAKIGCSQVAVHRYASGVRFPNITVARLINEATGASVPFELWQQEAARQIGIAA